MKHKKTRLLRIGFLILNEVITYSSTISKVTVASTSLWTRTTASYLPTCLIASPCNLINLRSMLWPAAFNASAIWMVLTEPKIFPFSPTLAPTFKVVFAIALATFCASSCSLAILWARCFKFSANTFLADSVAKTAFPWGIKKLRP